MCRSKDGHCSYLYLEDRADLYLEVMLGPKYEGDYSKPKFKQSINITRINQASKYKLCTNIKRSGIVVPTPFPESGWEFPESANLSQRLQNFG